MIVSLFDTKVRRVVMFYTAPVHR